MASALVLQHVAVEGPGLIGEVLAARGVRLDLVRIFAGEPVPARLEHDALVVMGGPMGVYDADRHPHLAAELRLLEHACAAARPVLGTCLGSQLLAAALGARVYPNTRKEIGWHEVTLAPAAAEDALLGGAPARFTPLHWHGDVFELPAGAVPLAASALTATQAFRHGRNAWGLLFHLELDRAQLDTWMTAFAAELAAEALDPAAILAPADARLAAARPVGREIFTRFAAHLVG